MQRLAVSPRIGADANAQEDALPSAGRRCPRKLASYLPIAPRALRNSQNCTAAVPAMLSSVQFRCVMNANSAAIGRDRTICEIVFREVGTKHRMVCLSPVT